MNLQNLDVEHGLDLSGSEQEQVAGACKFGIEP
jgi:hypothetical protein